MRYGDAIAHLSPRRAVGRRRGADRLAPLLAHVRAARLDRQLATGTESWHTPVHAARSRQLTSERTRRALARSLERLVEQAEEPPRLGRAAIVFPSRARVREARPVMLTLAARLRGSAPVAPRAMAALRDLLCDGAGPVYTRGDPNALKRRLHAIETWLDVQD
jgi:hypothetical protein